MPRLDVEKINLSPGVRRIFTLLGFEAPFDHGRRQIEMLGGLQVSTKAVERTAESVGPDIGSGEESSVNQAIQLHLPIILGKPIPILYVQMADRSSGGQERDQVADLQSGATSPHP